MKLPYIYQREWELAVESAKRSSKDLRGPNTYSNTILEIDKILKQLPSDETFQEVPRKIIYIAAPYGHSKEHIVEKRVNAVNAYYAHILKNGNNAISPVTNGQALRKHISEHEWDHKFWMPIDLQLLSLCDEMHVLCLSGWKNSQGVKMEIGHCIDAGIPIKYVSIIEQYQGDFEYADETIQYLVDDNDYTT